MKSYTNAMKTLQLLPLLLLSVLTACNTRVIRNDAASEVIAVDSIEQPPTEEELQQLRFNAIVAECVSLYEQAASDSHDAQLTTYCCVDIDDDGIDELWLRSEDKRYGAFFTINGEPSLICTESPSQRAKLYVGRIRTSGAEGRSGFVYANYLIVGSSLAHTFTKLEVYGEVRECHLDGRSLSYNDCFIYQEKLPRNEIPLISLTWQEIQ